MYGSHDMRHTCFPQVNGGQLDPRESGHHKSKHDIKQENINYRKNVLFNHHFLDNEIM